MAPKAPPPAKREAPSPPLAAIQSGTQLAAEYHASDWLKDLPAWLASLIFHLLLMIILGLWSLGGEEESPALVLSLSIGPEHVEGGEVAAEQEVNETEYELPVDKEPETDAEKEALVKADEDARELRLDPDNTGLNLPDLARVKADLESSDPYRRMHAARDPRMRAELVSREGGTTMTEAAVARALRWMCNHQNADGSWSLHNFHHAGDCQGRCGPGGRARSDTSGTALVLLALLGTGQTHKTGIYRQKVAGGLRWLIDHQKVDGDLRYDSAGNAGMYAHGQAAIVLCDAFKLTGDESLRAPAQRAIDFICKAQHERGGWRYTPGMAGDTSVVGWQLMAMHSGKAAYLHVPEETALRAGDFLDSVQSDREGGFYSYQPRGGPTPTMTAEGLLSRMYLGWGRNEPGLTIGIEYLLKNNLPRANQPNIYYWYYATQVMHHWGGDPWQQWNVVMRDVLVRSQETSGHAAGSWKLNTPHGAQGGRLYMTALAACTLEVYYRYAPLYYKLELE